MGRKLLLMVWLCLASSSMKSQDPNAVQIHGFATQGFIYSTSPHNNYLTPNTSDGDAGWTEAVISITDTPTPKLRVGVQLHYFHLSDFGSNSPQIDWALGDYSVNDYFGIRAGKVKTPIGLFNDTQDVDAVYLWSLLPQGIYQIDNRSFFLAHLGGEIYGRVPLGDHKGKVTYRIYGGQNSLAKAGGYSEQLTAPTGLTLADPLTGPVYGADIRWTTPYSPLMLGVSELDQQVTGTGPNGSAQFRALIPAYYAQLDKGRFYLAGEYRREPIHGTLTLGTLSLPIDTDQRNWYAMTSYRATTKLQVGTYYSHFVSISKGSPTYLQENNSKDLVFSARYDFNSNFYAKAENHFLHGTGVGYYADDNPQPLKPRTDIIILKLGFDF